MPVGHLAPELVLAAGAVGIVLFAVTARRSHQRLAAWLAVTVLAAAATVTVIPDAGGQQLTFSGTWALDGVTRAATLIVLVATALTVLLSPEWLETDPRHGEWYALLLLSALGAVLVAGAADTMELVVGVLLSSSTGYTLAAYHRADALSVEAGIKFFLVGALAGVLLLTGVVLAFGLAGSTLYAVIEQRLAAGVGGSAVLLAVTALVVVGLAFKLGAVPAHSWVPDVAQGAPAPGAAFLTSVLKVGGLVALARVAGVLPADLVGWRPLVAGVAAATMTLGNLAALWQEDVRRLLGWSAVSQSGYGIMAVVAVGRSPLAVPALLFFLAAYTLATVAVFGAVTELRGRTRLESYTGLARRRPLPAAALAVGFLSFVGIPPLAGFAAKLTLFAATIDAGYSWLAVLAVANTVVSLFYYLRVLGPAYFGPVTEPVPVLGRWARRATVIATGGVVFVGVVAEPLLSSAAGALLLPG